MGNLQGKGNSGAYGSKGTKGPSQSIHLRDKKDLAGVGIIFRKGTDGESRRAPPHHFARTYTYRIGFQTHAR